MRFAWDPNKAVANERKHGISFREAITVFDDPYALIAPDEKHSTAREKRQWIIGAADPGILVAVFAIRQPGEIYRIISARRANRKERIQYEIYRRFPF